MGSRRVGKGWPKADASRSCDANSFRQCQPGYLLAPPQTAALVSFAALQCSLLSKIPLKHGPSGMALLGHERRMDLGPGPGSTFQGTTLGCGQPV